jgi:hypothetical protein
MPHTSTHPDFSSDHLPAQTETLESFAKSFSYGSRTDLNFKFLSKLSADQVGDFFQELLTRLGQVVDSGVYDPVHQHIYEWQIRAYAAVKGWTYGDGPFTRLTKPVSQVRLALLTSSGHFVDGDDPKPFGLDKMTQAQAIERIDDFLREPPGLSAIPSNTDSAQLRVRHGGYDIQATAQDPNVAFPLPLLREWVAAGKLGSLLESAYSFVGACAQTPLLKRTAPQWAQMLKDQQPDGLLLVPV